MAQGGSLKFVVEVAANNATQTLQAIQTAVDQAGVKMKTTMLGLSDAARGAAGGHNSFEQSLKSLKTEMVQGDRTINFFANSLNKIVPATSAAGEGIRLLADGLVGGLGLGLAIQGIMAILSAFGESLKAAEEAEKKAAEASKKAADDRYKAYEEADKKFRKLQFIRGGGTAEAFEAKEANASAEKDITAAQKAVDQARFRLDSLRNSTTGARPNPIALENARSQLEEAEKALATIQATASRIVAVGASESEKAAGEMLKKALEAREAADRAWAENIENAIKPRGFESPGNTAPFVRSQEVREWMPRSSMGGIGADLDKLTDQFNESTRKRWKADDRMLAEATKAGDQIGKAFAQPIVSSLEDAFAQMITGQKNFNDSMKDLWKSLAGSLAKTAISMAFSFIPGIGPLASAGGLGGLLGGSVPSAAGGWSVPKGWNGLAMIHEEEVVLDRQTKRALMNGGGGSVSVSISAVDAPSLVALMQNNPEAILGPIREARRDRRF